MINKAQGTTYTSDDVYGAPVMTLKNLKKDKKWTNLFDLMRDSLTHFDSDVKFYYKWDETPDELGFKDLMNNEDFCERVRKLNKDSKFQELLLPVMDDFDAIERDTIPTAKNAVELDRLLNKGEKDGAFDSDATPYFESGAFDVYPMLTFVGSIRYSSYDRTDPEVLFDYIQLVDRS